MIISTAAASFRRQRKRVPSARARDCPQAQTVPVCETRWSNLECRALGSIPGLKLPALQPQTQRHHGLCHHDQVEGHETWLTVIVVLMAGTHRNTVGTPMETVANDRQPFLLRFIASRADEFHRRQLLSVWTCRDDCNSPRTYHLAAHQGAKITGNPFRMSNTRQRHKCLCKLRKTGLISVGFPVHHK